MQATLKTVLKPAQPMKLTQHEKEMIERREQHLRERAEAGWRNALSFSYLRDKLLQRKLARMTPMQQALMNNPDPSEFEGLARKAAWNAERRAAREAYLNRETQPSPFPLAFEHVNDGGKYAAWYASVMQVWRARKRAELQQAVADIDPGNDAHQDARIEMSALRHELLAAEAADGLRYIDQALGPAH